MLPCGAAVDAVGRSIMVLHAADGAVGEAEPGQDALARSSPWRRAYISLDQEKQPQLMTT